MKKKTFAKHYIVYSDGRVWSNRRSCFLRPELTKQGYLQVTIYMDDISRRYKVHRLVAYCFCDPPDNYRDMVVNHIDGDKSNNNYTNLEWCTQRYNNFHARINELNNISVSNSMRWEDPEWSEKTRKRFSEVRILNGSFKGKKNPRFKYEITDEDGNEYLIDQLAELIGLGYTSTWKRVRKSLQGIPVKEFIEYGITVKDISMEGQSTIERTRCEKTAS